VLVGYGHVTDRPTMRSPDRTAASFGLGKASVLRFGG
jgi:hypothetical protein